MNKVTYLFSLVGFLALTGLVEAVSGSFSGWRFLPEVAGEGGYF